MTAGSNLPATDGRPFGEVLISDRRVTNKGVQKTADQILARPIVCALGPLESIVRPK